MFFVTFWYLVTCNRKRATEDRATKIISCLWDVQLMENICLRKIKMNYFLMDYFSKLLQRTFIRIISRWKSNFLPYLLFKFRKIFLKGWSILIQGIHQLFKSVSILQHNYLLTNVMEYFELSNLNLRTNKNLHQVK